MNSSVLYSTVLLVPKASKPFIKSISFHELQMVKECHAFHTLIAILLQILAQCSDSLLTMREEEKLIKTDHRCWDLLKRTQYPKHGCQRLMTRFGVSAILC